MKTAVLVLALVTNFAIAAPDISKRPMIRDRITTEVPQKNIRPVARALHRNVQLIATVQLKFSIRPLLRPRIIERKAMARLNARRKGQVCGDPDLQGEEVGSVSARIKGCGIKEAVRLRSVSGVKLSQASLMDCPTAKALKNWTEKSAKNALRSVGGGLKEYRIAAHYVCRTRNNKKGARISEHGRGRALDISGFVLKDGTQLTVLRGWNSRYGKALKLMHKGACGPFGTVLGPRADRFHRDHFHFDTARHRSGPYCR